MEKIAEPELINIKQQVRNCRSRQDHALQRSKKAIYKRIIKKEPAIWFLSSKTSLETLFANLEMVKLYFSRRFISKIFKNHVTHLMEVLYLFHCTPK